uniref:Uncharacterized membrane protein YckC, RDD family n=2 Tax=Candidatus Kentrum sp. FW TaxID=2126338 RepID=A0A450T2G5_9GAMM|nr:MAG: Uncharacterized membrane protein YckC, RDD family [Candidatus Kentron sp. FW]
MKNLQEKSELSVKIPNPEYRSAGFFRRIGAIIYDSLLLIAILFFAHIPLQLFLGILVVPSEHPWHPAYQMYLLGVCFLYFGWFWMRGGQTLGMRTWRIRLQDKNGGRITWWRAGVRFLSAILSWSVFGLGFLWALIDRERKTWHDRLSGTVLVSVPTRPKS